MNSSILDKNDAKKVFKEKGTCSRTFFHILNREFGHPIDLEERATDPLAGGIMLKGHQCGMLWGSAMAVGAEAFRRAESPDQAIGLAIHATREIMDSFTKRTETVNCREITNTDFSKKFQMLKFMLFKTRRCFNLAEDWAPEAVEAAKRGLSVDPALLPKRAKSCASEVVKKMGGSEKERAMAAGLAGGMGLNGHACGALSAAIWMKTIDWYREHPEKMVLEHPEAQKTLEAFKKETNSEMLCPKICRRKFNSVEEHTRFINNGGCSRLIEVLASS